MAWSATNMFQFMDSGNMFNCVLITVPVTVPVANFQNLIPTELTLLPFWHRLKYRGKN